MLHLGVLALELAVEQHIERCQHIASTRRGAARAHTRRGGRNIWQWAQQWLSRTGSALATEQEAQAGLEAWRGVAEQVERGKGRNAARII